MHATLQPTLSVGWSVGRLVSPSHFFYQFYFFKSFKVIQEYTESFLFILSHSNSICKSRTRLIGVGLVFLSILRKRFHFKFQVRREKENSVDFLTYDETRGKIEVKGRLNITTSPHGQSK